MAWFSDEFFSMNHVLTPCLMEQQSLFSTSSSFSEFMSGGSVYDALHKQNGVLKLPATLKVAIDVTRGMSYLHQNNIIHRDLKAANLLMDENEVRNHDLKT